MLSEQPQRQAMGSSIKTVGAFELVSLSNFHRHHNTATRASSTNPFVIILNQLSSQIAGITINRHQTQYNYYQSLRRGLRVIAAMCTFTTTAFKMCGHKEYRGARCSPPIVHWNNIPEPCKKTPVHIQDTKNGICEQCRTTRLEASQAKSRRAYAERQRWIKRTRSSLPFDSETRKPAGTDVQIASTRDLYMKKNSAEGGAGSSSLSTQRTLGVEDLKCKLVSGRKRLEQHPSITNIYQGLSHEGPCLREKILMGQSRHVST